VSSQLRCGHCAVYFKLAGNAERLCDIEIELEKGKVRFYVILNRNGIQYSVKSKNECRKLYICSAMRYKKQTFSTI